MKYYVINKIMERINDVSYITIPFCVVEKEEIAKDFVRKYPHEFDYSEFDTEKENKI